MTSRNLVPANKLFTGSSYRFLTYNSNVAYPNPLSNIYNATGVEVMNISQNNVRIYGTSYISGSVGIGTILPLALLHVNGTVRANGGITINSTTFTNGNQLTFTNGLSNIYAIQQIDNAFADRFRLGRNGFDDISISSSGNVGIGNPNPPVALTVSRDASLTSGLYAGDNAQGQLYLTGSTNTNKRLALLYDTTTNKGYIQSMIAGTGATPLVLNNAGGFVGIGVGSPTQALDVAGNINFTGELYKNGALYNAMRYIGESATDYGATGTTVVIQQRSGNGPVGYTYGMLTTFNGESGRLQMYAPHSESGSSALYVKTGWNSSIMAWKRVLMAGDTVTTSLAVNAEISTNTMMRINYTSPTICFQDTDHNSAFLHCNANLLYVLRGGTNATSWTPINGVWPWEWNLTNNASICGGDLTVLGKTIMANDVWHTSRDGNIRTYYGSGGDSYYQCAGGGNMYFRNGYGINCLYIDGVNSRVYSRALYVDGAGSAYYFGAQYYLSFGNNGTTAGKSFNAAGFVQLYVAGIAFISTHVFIGSDERIKTNIQDAESNKTIDIIKALKPKTYTYKDVLKNGNATHHGLIAQDVESVYPVAVTSSKDFIPNILTIATDVTSTETSTTFTLPLNLVTVIKLGDTLKLHYQNVNTTASGQDVNQNTIDDAQESSIEVVVIKINGSVITVDKKVPSDKVYVYGTQVDDFKGVDYISFIPLLISTCQSLLQKNQTLEDRIALLEQKINGLNVKS